MIVRIPLELKHIWDTTDEKDRFLQHIMNIRRSAERPYIARRETVLWMFDRRRANPYNDHVPYIFTAGLKCHNPERLRYMHIDLGLTKNAAGISCCYVDRFINPLPNIPILKNAKPYIIFDFVARIQSQGGVEISFPDIENMIYNLSRREFRFALITFDRFQSVNMMQNLKYNGFIVANLSMDRTTHKVKLRAPSITDPSPIERISTEGQYNAAWQSLKDAIYEKRVSIPYYVPLADEIEVAQQIEKAGTVKIVAQGNKSLDCLESVAGSAFNAVTNVIFIGEDPIERDHQKIADPFYKDEQRGLGTQTFANPDKIMFEDPFFAEYGVY